MGHQRIGRLPRAQHWQAMLEILDESADTAAVAGATMRAAQTRLAELTDETALNRPGFRRGSGYWEAAAGRAAAHA
jgi:hypothetical protein